MSDKEAFYDKEVAPKLLELGKICEREGLSLVAVVEWEPGEQGRTVTLAEGSGIAIRLVEVSARVKGNIDSLIIAAMKHAREHGHSSMFLAQLGVPATPESH